MKTGIQILRGASGLVRGYRVNCTRGFRGRYTGVRTEAAAEVGRPRCAAPAPVRRSTRGSYKFHCRTCGRSFRTERAIKIHAKYGHALRTCPFCGDLNRIKLVAQGSPEKMRAITGLVPRRGDHITVYRCGRCGRQESSAAVNARIEAKIEASQ